MLTKTTTILTTDGQVYNHEDLAHTEFDGVTFYSADVHEEPEDRSDSVHTQIVLPLSIWQELGAPREITITIEPGDMLNV